MRAAAFALAALAVAALLAAALPAAAGSASPRASAKKQPRTAKRCAQRARCAVVRRKRRRAARSMVDRLVPVTPGFPAPDPGGPRPPAPDPPALPSFVSVAAREFSLTLSRPVVGAGDVRVELRNLGEDPHNLVLSPEGTSTPLSVFSELDPGQYERRTVGLSPGRYRLWCSLEFHEGLGMKVTLRVE